MIIYLDLDEVLADFLGSFQQKIGRDLSNITTWNLSECTDISQETLNKYLNFQGHKFWRDLKKLPKANDLVNKLEYYGHPIYIVSTPTKNPGSWSGKKAWVDKHFPQFSNHIILTRAKHLLSKSNTVLIDDSPSNLYHFQHHGNGKPITYPQLWNDAKDYVGKEIEYITQILEENVELQTRSTL